MNAKFKILFLLIFKYKYAVRTHDTPHIPSTSSWAFSEYLKCGKCELGYSHSLNIYKEK